MNLILTEAVESGSKNLIEQINLGDILVVALNVIILFAGLTYLLYKPVKKFMLSRHEELEKIAVNNQTREESLKIKEAELEAEKEKVRAESSKIGEDAIAFADQKKAEIIAEAYLQKEKIIASAETEIEAERSKMESKITDLISDVSIQISEKVLKEKITAEIDDQIIERCIKEYEERK